MSHSAKIQLESDQVRDIRIMLRQGKSVGYVAGVFGWTGRYFQDFCDRHSIPIPGAARIATDPAPNLSVRRKKRGPADGSRPVQISFNTAAPIAGGILEAARERNTSVSVIVDAIVTGARSAGMWPELLNSVSVASASHPNQKHETQ